MALFACEGGVKNMTLREGTPEGILLKIIKEEGNPVGFRTLLKREVRNRNVYSRIEKRNAIWNLLDEDLIDITEDYKIILKTDQLVAT
jgi:hypothetical protein